MMGDNDGRGGRKQDQKRGQWALVIVSANKDNGLFAQYIGRGIQRINIS